MVNGSALKSQVAGWLRTIVFQLEFPAWIDPWFEKLKCGPRLWWPVLIFGLKLGSEIKEIHAVVPTWLGRRLAGTIPNLRFLKEMALITIWGIKPNERNLIS